MVKGRQKSTSLINPVGPGSANAENAHISNGSPAEWLDAAPFSDADEFQIDEVADSWLRLRWQLSRKMLARAESSMGRDGYRKQWVVRAYDVDTGETGLPNKTLLTQIDIPEDRQEWFLFLPRQVPTCLIELGIVFGKGRYFSLLRSNLVLLAPQMARPSSATPLGTSTLPEELDNNEPPPLTVRGQFVLTGETRGGVRMLIDDQDIPVDPPTGQFEWKLPLSNGRVVVPILASDGYRHRRALLAIETNFHLLPPEPKQDD